jgi:hypothetical protein
MHKDTNFDNSAQTAANGATDANLVPNIPQGASLGKPPAPETGTGFPDAVFNDLPDLLWSGCNALTDPTEREVFLVSGLGVISGLFPNVQGFYDGAPVWANLYVYLLAQYGSGKGGAKYAYQLGRPIHRKRRELSAQLMEQYKAACIEAKANNEPPPNPPGNKLLYAPANNSKAGLVENLAENDGALIVFETEGDTFAQTQKTDFGNFSDEARKAFHHERISSYRKTGSVLTEVETPRLSMVLTSTVDQLFCLIPNVHNGLFSRFLYYRLPQNHDFKNVFDDQKRSYPEHFEALGKTFLDIYEYLETHHKENPINFDLRPHQKATFLEVFREWKSEVGEYVSHDLDGTINRLGLICYRVAMILTSVRNFAVGDYSPYQLCDDLDFNNAVRIVEVLKRHAVAVFYDLPNVPISREAAAMEKEFSEKAQDVARCRALANQGKNYAQISQITGIPKTTVYRWLTVDSKKQKVERSKNGTAA